MMLTFDTLPPLACSYQCTVDDVFNQENAIITTPYGASGALH